MISYLHCIISTSPLRERSDHIINTFKTCPNNEQKGCHYHYYRCSPFPFHWGGRCRCSSPALEPVVFFRLTDGSKSGDGGHRFRPGWMDGGQPVTAGVRKSWTRLVRVRAVFNIDQCVYVCIYFYARKSLKPSIYIYIYLIFMYRIDVLCITLLVYIYLRLPFNNADI